MDAVFSKMSISHENFGTSQLLFEMFPVEADITCKLEKAELEEFRESHEILNPKL